MVIRIGNRPPERGSVLLTTLMLAVILGLTIGGYLYWVRTQNLLVAESQAWNAALVHAEAGVEEALAQLNVVFGTNYHSSAATNWGGSGLAGYYGPRAHAFDDGSYSTIIFPFSNNGWPKIISTGYATVPIIGRRISRTVEVHTGAKVVFSYAIESLGNVTMNGNYVMVDSYDSSDPAHSTPQGLYDPTTRKAGGDVCSVEGIITVGNADVFGHVRTSPWGSASTGPNGRVGDLPVNWNGTGIQPGWYLNDYNAEFRDVTPPFTTGLPVTAVNSGTNTYVLGSGEYLVPGNFTIQNGQTLCVTGNAKLWVQGNFTMVGQQGSFISIAPGASLSVYVGTVTGPPVTASFTTVNSTGNAKNFSYYGLPSNTSLNWSGNSSYMGTVYAPQASFTLTGSGATTVTDYQGSCVARSVVLNGHFNVHYDESLRHGGPLSGFIAGSWREL